MLEVKGIDTYYGNIQALRDVSLRVDDGEIVTLIGANGAGKSTTLRAITGIVPVKSGTILYNGEDITGMSVDQRAKLGIGMMMQRPPNVIGVKLGELVKVTAANGKGTTGRENEFNMQDFMERDVNVGFSGGEIKRSELLQLSAQSPDFVMLDEPESGVDLESIGLIGKQVHELIYGSEEG